jgi:hypothetical protein
MGVVLLLVGIAVVVLGVFASLIVALEQGDSTSSSVPDVVFIVGCVAGAALGVAGIVLLVAGHRRRST